jgi:Zn-dependent protease
MNLTPAQLYDALLSYVIVIASLTFHEWGHAKTADQLGDDTPRSQGRVTLNPLVHIDLFGTVIIPLLAIFSGIPIVGWAKPVMINPDNLPKVSDRAWVTLAGPGMNLILALFAAVALGLALKFPAALAIVPLLGLVLQVNVALMVFNLLPVPPLDGSKFLMYWFGMREATYAAFARFGWLILMVALNVPQTRGFLGALIRAALRPFETIVGFFA